MERGQIIERSEQWRSGVRSVSLKFRAEGWDLKSVFQTADDDGNWRPPVITNGLSGDDLPTQEKEYQLLGHALKIARKWNQDTGRPHGIVTSLHS